MDLETPTAELTPPPPRADRAPSARARLVAAGEVLLCSDYPTQFLLGVIFHGFGLSMQDADGGLSFNFIVLLSLIDTVLLLGLIFACLHAHGESPREVFLGARPIAQEARLGMPLTVVAFVLAVGGLLTARWVMPGWKEPRNPFQDVVTGPGSAAMFALVVVIAGGIREEVQRAFLLHRFEHWLGGIWVGVGVTSLAFGAGHLVQGADAVVATTILGAFWAIVYVRRRSVVAQVVSHSSFNLLQLLQLVAIGR
ncbi:MAG: CPBP family intramembrane metalloprotease [Acidobacteriaceae bacterium]|jgi:membrane protease YdiL (CAAX protease family)|nr:CPBP family intramembrane metalloprotease [Acidobacteriaceae bacterium]